MEIQHASDLNVEIADVYQMEMLVDSPDGTSDLFTLQENSSATPIKPKTFECNVCKKRFASKGNLKVHFRLHTGERPFSCNICPKTYVQKMQLEAHLILHAREKCLAYNLSKRISANPSLKIPCGQMSFACVFCKKEFPVKARLKAHLRRHAEDKPFTCVFCNKAFAFKEDIKIHLRIHTKEKPFSCDLCSKAFSHKSSLNKHLRVHASYTLVTKET